jgi:hypothetical protein
MNASLLLKTPHGVTTRKTAVDMFSLHNLKSKISHNGSDVVPFTKLNI